MINLEKELEVRPAVQISGDNKIGVSEIVAAIVARNGGDTKVKTERVSEYEKFLIRMLLIVGYEGKKRIEKELSERYSDCLVV